MSKEEGFWRRMPRALAGVACALSLTTALTLTTGAALVASETAAHAKTLRFAFQGTLNALDP
jgi:hypothetical protein